MPRWIRVYTYKEIESYFIEQEKQSKAAQDKSSGKTTLDMAKPNISTPDYSTKLHNKK